MAEFPLTRESVVFDLGAYVGGWAHGIWERYEPRLYCFEPVATHFTQLVARVPQAQSFPFGLAPETGEVQINVNDDSSSVYPRGGSPVTCRMVAFSEFVADHALREIELAKVNIEGSEYDLFDHLIITGQVAMIRHLMIQFHDFVPNAVARYEAIAAGLAKTHRLWDRTPFCWENWGPLP